MSEAWVRREVTIRRLVVLALCSILSGLSTQATGVSNAVFLVKVNIVTPPCTINNNQDIIVAFGEMMATRVDGNNYRMPVNYTLDCKNAPSSAMKLQMQGSSASFDGTLLGTDNPALGIKILNDATPLSVNTWMNFTYPDKPELWAVPVKRSGVTLATGEFFATATMKIDYQ
ncbi:fimbrial protein [Serratia liquefaciens]|uniref:fimbrial protein n=1 Tax=Serratia liquefaciens TaxID=614 RepID=UPI0032DE8E7A